MLIVHLTESKEHFSEQQILSWLVATILQSLLTYKNTLSITCVERFWSGLADPEFEMAVCFSLTGNTF